MGSKLKSPDKLPLNHATSILPQNNHLSSAIKYHMSIFCKHNFKFHDNSSSVVVGINHYRHFTDK